LSSGCERVLHRAAALARQFRAELAILHVTDESKPKEFERAAAALSARIAPLTWRSGTRPGIEIRAGKPWRVIVSKARELRADLIVLGPHRKRILSGGPVGTTAGRILRAGDCAVLVVNSNQVGTYRGVLFALDRSVQSARAIRTARSLGLLNAGDVSIVHSFAPPYTGMLAHVGVDREIVAKYSAGWNSEVINELSGLLESVDVTTPRPKIILEEARPLVAIRQVVDRLGPQLLIIGTRGHRGLKRFLRGSVTEQVLRRIECDVLAIPPGAGKRAHGAGEQESAPPARRESAFSCRRTGISGMLHSAERHQRSLP
jgi:nucleotide-binding universal stress UspA family protein